MAKTIQEIADFIKSQKEKAETSFYQSDTIGFIKEDEELLVWEYDDALNSELSEDDTGVRTGRSDTYNFTVKKGDPKGHEMLQAHRDHVKMHNKTATQKMRVQVKGRLGKKSPHYAEHKASGRVDVKPEHATHFDVYTTKR